MRVEVTVTRVYEMDEARVLAEPGFEPPPSNATEAEKREWLIESFYELCGWSRDRDHLDGGYVWLMNSDEDSDFVWAEQSQGKP